MRQAELIRYAILAAQRDGNLWFARELRARALTPSQAEVLRVIGDDPNGVGLVDLGRLLVCESGTNPSRLVDRLVAAGLVQRLHSRADRRRLVLTLTSAGEEAERFVRGVEARMYAQIDAACGGAGGESLVSVLLSLSAGQSAGSALERRLAKAPE
ncbi:MarR family transcriptional regulator [Cryobacterium algoricola]|uniref:MarR family transcriptional regulator n=1 Tax=Cryobacterium algoricola TaxID=1259183 RepID=A0ABY2IIM6_9MICO|nr:winged helix DNA-binding protein [Cryobacterium algoricola]TFB90460.1 MarR family transcriptional regulator [Cryobacterium algoricola]